jgi:beta-galactosidase
VYFNNAWKWTKSDISGSEATSFNDASWEDIGVPHTFNDWDAFDGSTHQQAHFDYWQGAVRYRKKFQVPDEFSEGRRVFIEFEGVSQLADVWLNGQKIIQHIGSAMPFVVDITDRMNFGSAGNVLAVRAENTDQACFALPGGKMWCTDSYGGIIRDVWLHITDDLYIPFNIWAGQESWGTYAATLSANETSAEIAVRTQVKNAGGSARGCRLVTVFVDDGNEVALSMEDSRTIGAGETFEFSFSGTIPAPRLWSPSEPNLYMIYSIVYDGDEAVDVFKTRFGIRTFEFTPDGFYCNGEYLKLRGFGFRQGAYGGLTTAISNYLHVKDMRLAKQAGANFMRTGHCAADPSVIEACDRLGMFLDHPNMHNETEGDDRYSDDPARWLAYKRVFQRDVIVRDRNSPSVLLWEFGNGTIQESWARELKDTVEKWDHLNPRPTTSCGNSCDDCPNNVVDVISSQQLMMWCKDGYPGKAIFATEYGWNFANYHRLDWNNLIYSAWKHLVGNNGDDGWVTNCEHIPQWVGLTVWALYETPGEAHNGGACSDFGLLDANGRIPKPLYHAFEAAFSDQPRVRIAGGWAAGSNEVPVSAFCSPHIERVELFVDNNSQGIKNVGDDRFISGNEVWRIQNPGPGIPVYATGADNSGHEVSSDTMFGYGQASKIVLSADPETLTADGSDCSSIIATVCDSDGNWHRTDTRDITFSWSGPVNYRGGFNHDRENSTGKPTLHAQLGKIACAIRSTNVPGTITVNATASGLEQGSIQLPAIAPVVRFEEDVGVVRGTALYAPSPRPCLRITRNPNSSFTVSYTMVCPGTAEILFLDMKGRVTLATVRHHAAPGRQSVVMKLSKAPAADGVYVVWMKAGGRTESAVIRNIGRQE